MYNKSFFGLILCSVCLSHLVGDVSRFCLENSLPHTFSLIDTDQSCPGSKSGLLPKQVLPKQVLFLNCTRVSHVWSSAKSYSSFLSTLFYLVLKFVEWLHQEDAETIQISSAKHVENSQLWKIENPLMIFAERHTTCTSKSSSVTGTNHGLRILFARHGRNTTAMDY